MARTAPVMSSIRLYRTRFLACPVFRNLKPNHEATEKATEHISGAVKISVYKHSVSAEQLSVGPKRFAATYTKRVRGSPDDRYQSEASKHAPNRNQSKPGTQVHAASRSLHRRTATIPNIPAGISIQGKNGSSQVSRSNPHAISTHSMKVPTIIAVTTEAAK